MTTVMLHIPENKIDILSALKTLLQPFKDISFEIKKEESWDTVFTEKDKEARIKALKELENGETFSIDELKKNFIKEGYEI